MVSLYSSPVITSYSNVDWPKIEDRKNTLAIYFFVDNYLVVWLSKKKT